MAGRVFRVSRASAGARRRFVTAAAETRRRANARKEEPRKNRSSVSWRRARSRVGTKTGGRRWDVTYRHVHALRGDDVARVSLREGDCGRWCGLRGQCIGPGGGVRARPRHRGVRRFRSLPAFRVGTARHDGWERTGSRRLDAVRGVGRCSGRSFRCYLRCVRRNRRRSIPGTVRVSAARARPGRVRDAKRSERGVGSSRWKVPKKAARSVVPWATACRARARGAVRERRLRL